MSEQNKSTVKNKTADPLASNYFDLKLIYDGVRIKLYRFEGTQNTFPTLYLTGAQYTDSSLITTELRSLGYTWWLPKRSKHPPTHILLTSCGSYCQRYIQHSKTKPPKTVQFIKADRNYAFCSDVLITVPRIPKIFDLDSGMWVVSKDLVYAPEARRRTTWSITLSPDEVREVELAGISNIDIQPYLTNQFICGIPYNIPTDLWLRLTSRRQQRPIVPEVLLRAGIMENSMPVQIDSLSAKYSYYQDNRGAYWQFRKKTLKSKQAEALVGVSCNVTIYEGKKFSNLKEVIIPLNVLDIRKTDNISLRLRDGHILELVAFTYYSKPDKVHAANQKALKFKSPFLHPDGFCFVNHEKDLKTYGIVKIQRNITAPQDKTFKVCHVANAMVRFLPGSYAFAKDTIRLQKNKLNTTTSGLKLKYKLPGLLTLWSVEDLIKYDQLMQTNEYDDTPTLRVGMRLIPVPDSIPRVCLDCVTFTNKNGTVTHKIWKKQNWLELVDKIKQSVKQGRITINKNEVTSTLIQAAALGLNIDDTFALYARLIGLTEMETLTVLKDLQTTNQKTDSP